MYYEAQVAADSRAPHATHSLRNYLRRLFAAVRVVFPSLHHGEITYECARCIKEPFFHNIPTDDQPSCGPVVPSCFDAYDVLGHGQNEFLWVCEEYAQCDGGTACAEILYTECQECWDGVGTEDPCAECNDLMRDRALCSNICQQ